MSSGAQPLRKRHSLVQDLAVQVFRSFALKRWVPGRHLVHQCAHGPPVHCLAVPLAQYHLWRHVLIRPAYSLQALILVMT